jgi:DNA invertase Pin-like site-specific DNA recombinase
MTDVLKRAGRKLRSARKAADDAYEAARIAALAAIAGGVPEAVVARELGVNRMTVRKWLGKR